MRTVNTWFANAIGTLNDEIRAGAFVIAIFRKLPAGDRLRILEENPAWLRYGTLDALLHQAHDELDRDPSQAHAITEWVIARVDTCPNPTGLETLSRRLRGRAGKEQA